MEPTQPKPDTTNSENNSRIEGPESDPYTGIFFEIEVLLENAKAGCIQRLKPLTTREARGAELFAAIQVYSHQEDFGLNYDTYSTTEDGTTLNSEPIGDTSPIPGLNEYIDSQIVGKATTTKQDIAFDERLRKRLSSFFSDCWKQAGGGTAKIPTYLSFDDDDNEFIDLTTGTTLDEDQILEHIGHKPVERKIETPKITAIEKIEKSPFSVTRDLAVAKLNTLPSKNEAVAFIEQLTHTFEEEHSLGQEGLSKREEYEGRIIVELKIGEILYLSNDYKTEGKEALDNALLMASQPPKVKYLIEHYHAVLQGVDEFQVSIKKI